MIFYALLFVMPAAMALMTTRPGAPLLPPRAVSGVWWFVLGCMVMAIGLRHEVGGDWEPYLHIYELANLLPLELLLDPRKGDAAYMVLNVLAERFGLGIYFVNFICGLLFCFGLVLFCRAQPLPWLALVVAVPFLVTVVGMGYTRQSVAIGLIMPGLLALERGRAREFVLWTVAAMMFHKSAAALLPLALLGMVRVRAGVLIAVTIAAIGALALLLDAAIQRLQDYEALDHDAAGALVRVAMVALPGACLLFLWPRFGLEGAQARFWFWFASLAPLQLLLLLWFESSMIVDRLALYWIPLQMFVWSRLPLALDPQAVHAHLITAGIVLYSAAVMLTWLLFAHNAYAFIDYRNLLFL